MNTEPYGIQVTEGLWPDQIGVAIVAAEWIQEIYRRHYDLVTFDMTGCLDSELL